MSFPPQDPIVAALRLAFFALLIFGCTELVQGQGHEENSSAEVDLGDLFNARTLVPSGDRSGRGFRGAQNEKYVIDSLPVKDGRIRVNGVTFELGPMEVGEANAVVAGLDDDPIRVVVDESPRADTLHFLSHGVGLNPALPPRDNGWAVVRIGYVDGSVQEEKFVYRNFYTSPPEVPALSAGVTDLESAAQTFGDRHLYAQSIPLDGDDGVEFVEFDFSRVADGVGNDAEFGILAVTLEKP